MVKSNGVKLEKVLLYGSYAKNNQHEWSDIDVALVADEFEGIGYTDKKLFEDIHIRNPFFLIQTKTFNTKKFSPKTDPFVEEILKTGIEIKLGK